MVRGGGELGSGIAHALHRAGLRVVVVDRIPPSALRHGVAFASAAVRGEIEVEGVRALHCTTAGALRAALGAGRVAVWTGDEESLDERPRVLVEARMRNLEGSRVRIDEAPVVLGLGPGIVAGRDAHYVIETNRGPHLGRVVRAGPAEPHNGVPGDVLGYREERILRAPRKGVFRRLLDLGDFVEEGEVVGRVEGEPVRAALRGMIRGLKLTGIEVGAGHKVGDVDPRRDSALLTTITDKSKALGEGALRALALASKSPPSAGGGIE